MRVSVLRLSILLCVLLCSGCGPVVAQAQQAPKSSLSQRISQWMVGRMGFGGLPGAFPGFPGMPGVPGVPSVTGMSGLGGFFGLSPMSGILSIMGLGTRAQPTYVPPPESAPPPPPPPPPAHSSSGPPPSHGPPSSSHGPAPSHGPPPHHHSPPPHHHHHHGGYPAPVHRPPPSSYRGHGPPGPYRGSGPISHGLPPPIYSGPPVHVAAYRPAGPSYRGPPPTGGFYKGRGAVRGPRFIFAEDASYLRPQVSPAIPIVVPRHAIRGPIRGPVAIKTPHGLMLGPFRKPVHQHGLPTIGDTPVIMDDMSMAGGLGGMMGHDLIESPSMSGLSGLSTMDQLSLKDMMTTGQASEDSMIGLDDGLPFTMDVGDMDMFDKGGINIGALGGDALLGDSMKLSDLGGELNVPAVMDDDLKSLDLKENLLASASERHEQHRHPIYGSTFSLTSNHQPVRTATAPAIGKPSPSRPALPQKVSPGNKK